MYFTKNNGEENLGWSVDIDEYWKLIQPDKDDMLYMHPVRVDAAGVPVPVTPPKDKVSSSEPT